MLKSALNSKGSKTGQKMKMSASKGSSDMPIDNEDFKETSSASEKVPLPKPKSVGKKPIKKGKKVTSKPTPTDTATKFFNSYSESPHLQAIEDSYLSYLQA